MSLGEYFFKKCTDALKENVSLILMKLSDPGNLVTFELSGTIVDAAKGGLGPLASFAGDFIKQNADVLILEAVKATGLEDTVQQAFNLVNNILAAAIMANNELVMFFVRRLAINCIGLLREKQEILAELSSKVTELYNLLKILDQGNPVYDPYIAQLRRALNSVSSARTDLNLVRSSFIRSDLWLSKRFESAKASIETAKNLVTPPTASKSIDSAVAGGATNKAALKEPATNPLAFGTTGKSNVDLKRAGDIALAGLQENPIKPSNQEQIQATISIPKVSKQVIEAAQGYFEILGRINASLAAYQSAMSQLTSGLPAFFKKYILSLFDPLVSRVDSIAGQMADILNGSPTAMGGPVGSFKPQPLTASVHAFKWGMELSVVLENFKTIPSGTFSDYDTNVTVPGFGPLTMVGTAGSVPLGSNQCVLTKKTVGRLPKNADRLVVSRADVPGNNKPWRIAKVETLSLLEPDDVYRITVDGSFAGAENPSPAIGVLQQPSGALDALNISQAVTAAYKQSVTTLQGFDNIGPYLQATDAQEQTGQLESQLLIFLLEANNALVSASVRKEVLGVAQAVLTRLAVTVGRDNNIATALQTFVNTPFELEDTVRKIGEGIFSLLQSAGLDNAEALLNGGDFTKFLKLNSKEATAVGAALAAVALLKSCFPDAANKEKLSEVEFELEKDADLLSIQFSVDFDLAIFKNLQNCLRFKSLGVSFSFQETFCGIVKGSGAGQSLSALKDVLSF
jgi:hypothetical protein